MNMMKLAEAKMKLAQDIANAINESSVPPTIVRLVLTDMDRMMAQCEEEQFQKALSAQAEKEGSNG